MTPKKTDDRTEKLVKRFYTDVSVEAIGDHAFSINLDGRAVKTPGKAQLCVKTEALASEIAAEWRAQGEKIDPNTMPLTQIGCTSIDRIATNRPEIQGLIAKYAETDLICYRASAPNDLVAMQSELWQPLLNWCDAELGIRLQSTTGILPIPQDTESLETVLSIIQQFDDHELGAVSVVTQASGSVVIAIALAKGRIDGEQAAKASQVDETHQSKLWGLDHEAEVRLKALNSDILAAEAYLRLHRS